MKIVKLQEFLTMPSSTVFMKFKPYSFGDIRIKGETNGTDFNFIDLTNVEVGAVSNPIDVMMDAHENGSKFKLNRDEWARDGMYAEDQLFAVFDDDDIIRFSNRLKLCLNSGDNDERSL